MESRMKKFNTLSLVFTVLTSIFFIGTVFFGFNAVININKSNENYELGDGISSIIMVLFLLISLIPTLVFAFGGVVLCISPLKNKYNKKANIFKLIWNIFIIVICILIVLILFLRK